MPINWLLSRMGQWADQPAVVWNDTVYDYRWILRDFEYLRKRLAEEQVSKGAVVAFEADHSPRMIALLLALVDNKNVVVPLRSASGSDWGPLKKTAEVGLFLSLDEDGGFSVERTNIEVENPLIHQLVQSGEPGLIVFSTGSTGTPKGMLHSFSRLLEKFKVQRRSWCTLSFLPLDHLGGLNTLLYTLSNGGNLVPAGERTPDSICRLVEKYRVQLLPTSPTFCNLLLVSGAYERHDLSSLELITYGTEVMPDSTLSRLHRLFPNVRLQQTYGLSELGVLRSKSKSSDSLWVKVGGDGFETKIKDGTLWIRADSAMLGYLNAPDPFDAEGWFNTEDQVEVDESGEYIRILGRRSEIINVGGEKVYPAEVENVLQQMANVRDVIVSGEANPIAGNIVVARIDLFEPETLADFKRRMRDFCQSKLARHQIPAKVELSKSAQFNSSFKRLRR